MTVDMAAVRVNSIRIRSRISLCGRVNEKLLHELAGEPVHESPAQDRVVATTRKLRAVHRAGLQYAALPYRIGDSLEVLLITSRDTGRWVLPKGWPMKGKQAHVAAAREALEEAGVRGKIGKRAIGFYRYGKRLSNGAVLACTVEVFPLAVERQMKQWREQSQRTLGWFNASDAAYLVNEIELADLIKTFAAQFKYPFHTSENTKFPGL